MKLLILLLILTVGAQPLQAGCCGDMAGSAGEMSQMQESGHDPDHECCDDPEPVDSSEGCDSSSHCGFCNTSTNAVFTISFTAEVQSARDAPSLFTGVLLPNHSSPPFRPPIS